MLDLSFSEMLKMQHELWEKNKDSWSPLEPQYARNHFLWMIAEIGEVLDIIKKCEEEQIMSDTSIKSAFVEELCDVIMYFNDILLRYNISSEDIANAYVKKHNKNMNRSFETEEKNFADNLRN
jgi:NTP pyrophosphatase (non-canonical NTP hydrolase)